MGLEADKPLELTEIAAARAEVGAPVLQPWTRFMEVDYQSEPSPPSASNEVVCTVARHYLFWDAGEVARFDAN